MMKYLPLLFLFSACQNPAPTDLGVSDSKFPPCKSSSNCVVSFDYSDSTFLSPIESEEEPERIYKKILGIISKTSSAKIIKQEEDYIYAEVPGALGTTDDVEFWFGGRNKVHFKSQGRLNFSDLGSNKKRIETIRFKFHQNDF